MLRYYDERASDYEDAYRLGTGTSSIPDPGVFQREAGDLAAIVRRLVHGRVIDLACGTGYWLQFYADQCSAGSRSNAKVELQERRLNDGTTLDVYKRYLDRADVSAWSERHGVRTEVKYFGDAFLAVSGRFAG